MIPPIRVTAPSLHYTRDALVERSRDLDRAATVVTEIATSMNVHGAGPIDAHRLVIHSECVLLASDIASLRIDIDGVIAALDPAEFSRATFATGAPWVWLRPVSGYVTDRSPWWNTAARGVPVSETRHDNHISPPRTLTDRFARIPTESAQVRIDRFETAAGPRFEVYIAGTDFASGPRNPWWAGANMSLLSAGQSDSLFATEAALRASGVTPSTPIVFTGHSQGGLIALALADSGQYTVDAVFTVGSPVGVVESDPAIPQFHVAHIEDPVPALGGLTGRADGTTWLAHTEPRVIGADAHVLDSYRSTVSTVEKFAAGELTSIERRVQSAGSGTARWYRASSSE